MNDVFTILELSMLSNGILALIRDASEAKKLLWDSKSQDAINEHIAKLQALNKKIYDMHKF